MALRVGDRDLVLDPLRDRGAHLFAELAHLVAEHFERVGAIAHQYVRTHGRHAVWLDDSAADAAVRLEAQRDVTCGTWGRHIGVDRDRIRAEQTDRTQRDAPHPQATKREPAGRRIVVGDLEILDVLEDRAKLALRNDDPVARDRDARAKRRHAVGVVHHAGDPAGPTKRQVSADELVVEPDLDIADVAVRERAIERRQLPPAWRHLLDSVLAVLVGQASSHHAHGAGRTTDPVANLEDVDADVRRTRGAVRLEDRSRHDAH